MTNYYMAIYKDVYEEDYEKFAPDIFIDFPPWLKEENLLEILVRAYNLDSLKDRLRDTSEQDYTLYEDKIIKLTKAQVTDTIMTISQGMRYSTLCHKIHNKEKPWDKLDIVWIEKYEG